MRESPGVDTRLGDCPCARADSLDSGGGRWSFDPSLVPFSTLVVFIAQLISTEAAFYDGQELGTASIDLIAFVA